MAGWCSMVNEVEAKDDYCLSFPSNSPQEDEGEKRDMERGRGGGFFLVVGRNRLGWLVGWLVGRTVEQAVEIGRDWLGGASGAGFKLQEHRGCYRCLSCAPVSLSISEQIKKEKGKTR